MKTNVNYSTTTKLVPSHSEIKKALSVLFEPGQIIELRALDVSTSDYKNPHTLIGYYDDPDVCADHAAEISANATGVFVVMNEFVHELFARSANRLKPNIPATTDEHIINRRWLLIDIDPVRPAGISSNDEEKAYALEISKAIRDILTGLGWPDPILADSGNGIHLLYRIDIPREDNELVFRVLSVLANFWNDKKVKIDTSVSNPSRITKLYGTLAKKGDSIPERPHRVSKILEMPASLETVGTHLLVEMAKDAPIKDISGTHPSSWANENGFDLENWITEHKLDVFSSKPWGSGQIWVLGVCPWNQEHTDRSAYIIQFSNGAIAAGCHHNGCQGKGWRALRDQLEPGLIDRNNGLRKKVDQNPESALSDLQNKQSERTPDELTDQPRKRHVKSKEFIDALKNMGYSFRLNEITNQVEANGEPMSDILEAVLFTKLRDSNYPEVNIARDAIKAHASTNSYHPIRDFLAGLVWDGTPRITELAGYFNNPDGTFPIWLRRWLIGAVRRAFNPGKQNRMLVLSGPQNVGKSRFVEWLVPPQLRLRYLRTGSINPDNKDHYIALTERWVWEVAELGSTTRRADVEALKDFISVEQVTVRVPYGRYEISKPALANFIGTVNPTGGVLSDPTGSRRYMFSEILDINWDYSTRFKQEDIWAEAMSAFLAGERADLTETEKNLANEVNDSYEIEEPLEGIILQHFEIDPKRLDWWTPTIYILSSIEGTGANESIAKFKGQTKAASMAIANVMASWQCKKEKRLVEGLPNKVSGYIGVKRI